MADPLRISSVWTHQGAEETLLLAEIETVKLRQDRDEVWVQKRSVTSCRHSLRPDALILSTTPTFSEQRELFQTILCKCECVDAS